MVLNSTFQCKRFWVTEIYLNLVWIAAVMNWKSFYLLLIKKTFFVFKNLVFSANLMTNWNKSNKFNFTATMLCEPFLMTLTHCTIRSRHVRIVLIPLVIDRTYFFSLVVVILNQRRQKQGKVILVHKKKFVIRRKFLEIVFWILWISWKKSSK